jgi:hypothetical protein
MKVKVKELVPAFIAFPSSKKDNSHWLSPLTYAHLYYNQWETLLGHARLREETYLSISIIESHDSVDKRFTLGMSSRSPKYVNKETLEQLQFWLGIIIKASIKSQDGSGSPHTIASQT